MSEHDFKPGDLILGPSDEECRVVEVVGEDLRCWCAADGLSDWVWGAADCAPKPIEVGDWVRHVKTGNRFRVELILENQARIIGRMHGGCAIEAVLDNVRAYQEYAPGSGIVLRGSTNPPPAEMYIGFSGRPVTDREAVIEREHKEALAARDKRIEEQLREIEKTRHRLLVAEGQARRLEMRLAFASEKLDRAKQLLGDLSWREVEKK